ncbi:hypothetical protein [Nocardia bhagyanarayanae]|uniref:Uncharacterized protein n=1 Tax=Nocardia bhagyanarayanae TaxID=1215925 RepID=A0A543FES4_9NOCA|nr:hypothetical protein [Nocardia bhagyanarayanae]TQM32271.1 hypothetical protein FB390_3949 [Nocardia bhagyanarayanae]
MKAAVRRVWLPFNEPLEGRVPWMYLDSEGFVSTGVGNKLDDTGRVRAAPTPAERAASLIAARRLPWRRPDGSPATGAEINAAWDAVKSRMDLVAGGYRRFADVTELRLTDEHIDRLVFARLDELETLLRGRMVRHGTGAVVMPFAAFDSWPADAQLGMLSMCWAMGPKFSFPTFQDAAFARDWLRCAAACRVNPEIGTVIRRNDRDQDLFRNAFRVEDEGLDPEVLLFRLPELPSGE